MNICLRTARTKYQGTAMMLSRRVASKDLGLFIKVRPLTFSKPTSFIPARFKYDVGRISYVSIRTKTTKRSKTKGSKEDGDLDDDTEQESDEIDDAGRDFKDISTLVNSLRIDNVIKAGLGITKSKVEEAFYGSRIRLNGEKVLKKSALVSVDDEVDLIKGQSLNNMDFTDISRVIVKEVGDTSTATHGKLKVTLRRFKNLTVDAYKE